MIWFVTDLSHIDRYILGQHIRGFADFFFQLNLLPPYSLRSQRFTIERTPKKHDSRFYTFTAFKKTKNHKIFSILNLPSLLVKFSHLFQQMTLLMTYVFIWENGLRLAQHWMKNQLHVF